MATGLRGARDRLYPARVPGQCDRLGGILVAANAFFLPSLTNLAGHVSKQMLKHCSHTRMEAKRRATDSLVVTQKTKAVVQIPVEPAKESTKVEVLQ
jgi:hypothetical protein